MSHNLKLKVLGERFPGIPRGTPIPVGRGLEGIEAIFIVSRKGYLPRAIVDVFVPPTAGGVAQVIGVDQTSEKERLLPGRGRQLPDLEVKEMNRSLDMVSLEANPPRSVQRHRPAIFHGLTVHAQAQRPLASLEFQAAPGVTRLQVERSSRSPPFSGCRSSR